MGGKRFGLALALLSLPGGPGASADSPLADATQSLDREAVRALLARGADVGRAQADGMTALHWAAFHDDPGAAKLLLDAGADPKIGNGYGVTPLSLACGNGSEAMVRLLLDAGADPNAPLRGGETPLMTAARTGKPGPVEALLARGAVVNAIERKGQTALMWAAADGNAEVVSILIRASADVRAASPGGFTPLLFAAREGRTEVARILIGAGAEVDAVTEAPKALARSPAKGTSPLVLAVENGHFELAGVLLDAGADPNDQRSGFTALHRLTWVRKPNRGDDESGDPPPTGSGGLSSLGLVEALVAHGADVNARLKRGAAGKGVLKRAGATPFLMASMTADVPLMKTLLTHGADPRLTNVDGCTPLMAAAGLGCLAPGEEAGTEDEALEAVRLSLALGNDVNAVDANGETAMHGAAYKSFPRVVKLLADSGARMDVWNRMDRYGWTPVSIAGGYRPGNFKPSPETLAALHQLFRAAGIDPPSGSPPATATDEYSEPAPSRDGKKR